MAAAVLLAVVPAAVHRMVEPFREYALAESGYVSRRDGLSWAWVAGGLAGVAALFGAAQPAAATQCQYLGCTTQYCGEWTCGQSNGYKGWLYEQVGENCVQTCGCTYCV